MGHARGALNGLEQRHARLDGLVDDFELDEGGRELLRSVGDEVAVG